MTVTEFLNTEPKEEDIRLNPDGSRYLPIEVIERDLDELGKLANMIWGTNTMRHFLFTIGDKTFCSGSLNLQLDYYDSCVTNVLHARTHVGAASFDVSRYLPNEHFAATLRSLCVANAAKKIGKRFGKGLNEEAVQQDTRTIVPDNPNITDKL
jgi:hypothetical protein